MKHIVLIGGGSGISNLLPALVKKNYKISAIIATSDSGGSTGVIRDSYTLPALGDISKNLAALSGASWMRYRYQEGFLSGHTAGNLWLLGLIREHGFSLGIQKAHEILGQNKNTIIPATEEPHDLIVKTKDGEQIQGEGNIIQNTQLSHNVSSIFQSPTVHASKMAIQAIKTADCIVIGPGTLYTSIIACLLPNGIRDSVHTSKAKKLFIANAANFPPGHCENYALSDYLGEIEKITGIGHFDGIIAHDGNGIPKENRIYCEPNTPGLTITQILSDPSEEKGGKFDSIQRNTLRHDGEKVAQWIKKYFD